MAVDAKLVKELRDVTGASMAECKKALEETGGDQQAAIEFLRKRGAASAAKRSDRNTDEGIVLALTNEQGTSGAIVEINCETDFVARNEDFVNFAKQVVQVVLRDNPATEDALLGASIGEVTLRDLYNETLAKFSEKIVFKRFTRVDVPEGFVTAYNHAGNRLGVLISFSATLSTDSAIASARDIAMQIAAMNPLCVDRTQVDNSVLEKEREIYMEQAIAEGKKPEIAERVAQGRINKFYEENCLIEQAFVKDSSKTVKDVVKDIASAQATEVSILSFQRFSIGG